MIRPLTEIEGLMHAALSLRGLSSEEAELVIDDYLGAQIEGRFTHGIGKFLLIDEQLATAVGTPTITADKGAVVIIDGGRSLGQVAAAYALKVICDLLERHPICATGLINFSRYSRLKPIASRIAQHGALGIVINGAGPAAVAPPGTKTPLLGTNPISIGIPGDPPLVIDLATSARPWGDIRQAILENRPLDSDAFIDQDGETTRDPHQVSAVRPMDGGKGFALCLALELVCNGLLPCKVGTDVETQFDLGGWFIAMRADIARDLADVVGATARLRDQLSTAVPRQRDFSPYAPGNRAVLERQKAEQSGTVWIDDASYQMLNRMAVERGVGLASSRLVD